VFPLAHGAYLLAVRSISRPQHKWRLTQAEQQSAALALQALPACRGETESIKAALTSDSDPYRLLGQCCSGGLCQCFQKPPLFPSPIAIP